MSRPRAGSARHSTLYRRAPTLVAYWVHGALTVRDYAGNARTVVDATAVRVLLALDEWQERDDVCRALPDLRPARVRDLIRQFRRAGLIESSNGPMHPGRAISDDWETWAPDAALLHFGTKNQKRLPLAAVRRRAAARLEIEDFPDGVKTIPGATPIALPAFARDGAVPATLLERRTWRRFGSGAVTLPQIATLLGLTWGIQQWMEISPQIRSPLKTSPSGGACHSIEAYLVASRIEGLPRGVYHYRPDLHALERVRRGSPPSIAACLRQPWFADCAAVVFMTSVFGRVRWKYPSSRAYRVLLMEAGHFAQTFCLVATWLKLAPFCTAAFADALVEKALAIDGVSEGVLYAVGVGPLPSKAPRKVRRGGRSMRDRPPTTPPVYLARRSPTP